LFPKISNISIYQHVLQNYDTRLNVDQITQINVLLISNKNLILLVYRNISSKKHFTLNLLFNNTCISLCNMFKNCSLRKQLKVY